MLNLLKTNNLFGKIPQKIAVAVSGGADSMYLTYLLNLWSQEEKVDLTALIVDHGLRSESSDEAKSVKEFLQSQGIKTEILKWVGDKPKSNIQSKARAARYHLLHDYCTNHNIKHLFVAHTLNDQAETVLMRIIRGSGIDGVSAIKPKTKFGNILLLRPLLTVDRAKIESHMKESGWPWINDPSNLNHKYMRVKVRFMLNSYASEFGDQKIYKRLGLLAENSRRTKSYLDSQVKKIWGKKVKVDPLNFLIIDNAVYNLHKEMKLRLFVRAFKYLNPNLLTPKLTSLTSMIHELESSTRLSKTLMGCQIIKGTKQTVIFLELGKNQQPLKLIPKKPNIWHNLTITTTTSDLTAKKLGASGWKDLKTLGFIKPTNTPIGAIHALLAVYKDDNLVAVPHLNFGNIDAEIL
jgi:tRNA(Ile)-lysidine synthase